MPFATMRGPYPHCWDNLLSVGAGYTTTSVSFKPSPAARSCFFERAGSYPFNLILLDIDLGGRTVPVSRGAWEKLNRAFLDNYREA